MDTVQQQMGILGHYLGAGGHTWTLCGSRWADLDTVWQQVAILGFCVAAGGPTWTLCGSWLTYLCVGKLGHFVAAFVTILMELFF